MTAHGPHLIVLRGNSGSGKTTLAAALQREMGRGTANVGQDHLRRVLLREHDVPGGDNIGLIDAVARHCLAVGYHVIVEGILLAQHYGSMLTDLVDDHDGPHLVFYLDVTLEETLRRHADRPLSNEVTPAQLRDWYVHRDLLGLSGEMVLDGSREPAWVLARMTEQVGPITPRSSIAGGRFL